MNCICPHCKKEIPASSFTGQIGKIKTEAKRLASIVNGKKGGRPKARKLLDSILTKSI
jgi:hypothetical protein